MRGLIVAAVAAMALSACGGGSTGAASSSTVTPESLASKLGCSFSANQTEMFAAESGSCGTYAIETFASSADRDKYLDAARQAAGGQYLVGPSWIVVPTSGDLTAAKSALGGDIK